MKILLDECVTKKVKPLLPDFEVKTVAEMGFSGLKNGKLLTATQEAGFDLLITIDKNMDFQQNISKFKLTIVVFGVKNSNIKYIQPLIPIFIQSVKTFQKGRTYNIAEQ